MLNKDALSQLSALKKDIQANKEYGVGVVAGTSGKFGFVRLEDGRDAFLSPEKMQRLLPGDKIKVSLTKNNKDKLEAEIEKLIDAPTDRIIGQYKIKGNAHFVSPNDSSLNRWIFIPPQNRKASKEGDFVIAKLSKHPFKDGKAQAHILERIGQPSDAFIEHKYTCAEYALHREQSPDTASQVQEIQKGIEALSSEPEQYQRENLSHLTFVTIDSPSTQDMDDALYLESLPDGKSRLYVAIADPASSIKQDSRLATKALSYGQTVYLLGGALPMYPEHLSNYCFSLVEGESRPSLVCRMDIDEAGNIEDFDFQAAIIRSHYKLNYQNVSAFLHRAIATPLNNEDLEHALPENAEGAIGDMLIALYNIALKRFEFRQAHNFVNHDQIDYRHDLDKKGRISAITPRPKSSAHQLVEEAMLATNQCAGKFLAQHNIGLHSIHKGFRTERLGEVKALLKEEQITPDADITTLEGHVQLLKHLLDSEHKHLVPALKRMMQSSELALSSGPHLGMGFQHYATVTSPIRRFADNYNHWAIYSIIAPSNTFKGLSDEELSSLNEALQTGRQADRSLTQWLTCLFVKQNLKKQKDKVFAGKIRIVTQQGFGVRLNDTGIDGFVLFAKSDKKSYDAKRMTLTVGDTSYQLESEVEIKISSVDMEKRRIAFVLAEQSQTAAGNDNQTPSEEGLI